MPLFGVKRGSFYTANFEAETFLFDSETMTLDWETVGRGTETVLHRLSPPCCRFCECGAKRVPLQALSDAAMAFLPTTVKEIEQRGWDKPDVVFVSGDAYIDHPSFGCAVICRYLESRGFRVAVLAQPNWRDDLRDFRKFGAPRLCFCVSSGSMDSMVNHYTAAKRRRSDDAYTPGGEAGFRPDRATSLYSTILKRLYPDTPVIIGGIEASMRRLAHYDYWDNRLFPSILLTSRADMLVYGMGEKITARLCALLAEGKRIDEITDVEQTAFVCRKLPEVSKEWSDVCVPSFEKCLNDKREQAKSICLFEKHSNKSAGERLVQRYEKENAFVVINPFDTTYCSEDLDEVHALPYERAPHPKYAKRGKIPAFEMIKYSVNIHRGCFGGCAFCTIAAHQGKRIISRSRESIMREVETISRDRDFKGYLSDLGGPSANMYMMHSKNGELCRKCSRPSCLYPKLCPNMDNSHKPLLELYAAVRALPYIKKAFIGSGVRYDLFDSSDYFEVLCRYHVSGRLKVAPEHCSDRVLKQMRKMPFVSFENLKRRFDNINRKYGLNQQLIPYFISSHPACTARDMVELASRTAALGYRLEQVQDFTPTPMTIATETYYTGFDIYTGEKVFTEKNPAAKKLQNRIFFWYKPENRRDVAGVFSKYGFRFPPKRP